MLEEVVVDQGAGDAHRDVADRKIRLATHRGGGDGSPGERQNFAAYVVRNFGFVFVLHVTAVDAERRQTLLAVSGQYGGQIHGAGALGAVEAPDGLRHGGVHVHRFGTVAPTGRNGQCSADAFAGEFGCRLGRLGHAADTSVGDDAFDRRAACVTYVFRNQFGDGLGHAHRLVFQRFTHALATSVDGRPNADLRKRADEPIDADSTLSSHYRDSPCEYALVEPCTMSIVSPLLRHLTRGAARLFHLEYASVVQFRNRDGNTALGWFDAQRYRYAIAGIFFNVANGV